MGTWSKIKDLNWYGMQALKEVFDYTCPHCGRDVASSLGVDAITPDDKVWARLRICPSCQGPAVLDANDQLIESKIQNQKSTSRSKGSKI